MEGNIPGKPESKNNRIEQFRASVRRMHATAEAVTRSLGLPPEDKGAMMQTLFGGGPQTKSENERGVDTKESVISMMRVDGAARSLTEKLGLPEEQRYDVMKTLWGEPTEGDAPSPDETMADVVTRMEKQTTEAREKLGLPLEKEEILMGTLFGDTGVELRTQYRKSHPKE